MNYFPIIIFGYNRPKLLKSCLLSLKKYDKLKKHKIYFFCDGPKNDRDRNSIRKIMNILDLVNIKFYKKYFLEKNYGLAKNIISGVSKILKKNKAAIILEDDLYPSKNAIPFINFFLNKKKMIKKLEVLVPILIYITKSLYLILTVTIQKDIVVGLGAHGLIDGKI